MRERVLTRRSEPTPSPLLRALLAALALAALPLVPASWAESAAQKASPAAEREEAEANRRFQKGLINSIERTLAPERPASGEPGSAAAAKAGPASVADATRLGMGGIKPASPFPANCMPILGLPSTGINPLLANIEQGPVRVAVLAELKGAEDPIGRNWRDGIQLAANIVNAGGGLLGRMVEVRTYDAGGPAGGRTAAAAALSDNPLVVLGPVTSGAAAEAIDVLGRVQVPHFIGTRGLEQLRNDNPYLFRTSTTIIEEAVQLGTYLRDQRKVRRVALVSSQSDYGEALRMMMIAGLRFSNIGIVQDLRLAPAAGDFRTAVLQVKDRSPDFIAVFMSQAETAAFLRAARAQGLDQPALVDGLAMGRRFLDEAGTAANGAIGLVGLHAEAPVVRIREMASAFEKSFRYRPSPIGVQGFIALNMVKAVVDKACSFNGPDLVKASRGLAADTRTEPGLLMDFSFGGVNNVFRDNFLFEVRNQKLSIVATLPIVTPPF